MRKIFYKHKLTNLVNVDKIVTVHYLEYPKDFKFEGESHDFWEIVYADTNPVYCSRGADAEFKLNKGELLFHRPDEFHTIRADGVNPANVFIISFTSKSEAMDFFDKKRFSADAKIKNLLHLIIAEALDTFEMPLFDPNLSKLELKSAPALGGLQMIKICLEQLLITLMRRELEKEEVKEIFIPIDAPFSQLEEKIKEYLKERVCDKLKLDELCAHFNYSKTFLCTKFKESTGHTIFSYFINQKIEKAKELIRTKSYNFSEISDILSFDTYSYFTKTFKRVTGYSPKTYAGLIKKI